MKPIKKIQLPFSQYEIYSNLSKQQNVYLALNCVSVKCTQNDALIHPNRTLFRIYRYMFSTSNNRFFLLLKFLGTKTYSTRKKLKLSFRSVIEVRQKGISFRPALCISDILILINCELMLGKSQFYSNSSASNFVSFFHFEI